MSSSRPTSIAKPSDDKSRMDAEFKVASPEEADRDGDESIHAYMMQLLERTRSLARRAQEGRLEEGPGTADRPCNPTPTTSVPAGSVSRPDRHPRDCGAHEKSPVKAAARRPPESADSIAAMRRLANSNARGAIERHSLKQLVASARRTLLSAVAMMLASFFFTQLPITGPAYGCALAQVSMLAAAISCWRYLLITEEMARIATTCHRAETGSGDEGTPGNASD